MKKGTVKFFNTDKGYGFIIEDNTKKEYFVHATNTDGEIYKGNRVVFDIGAGKKGEVAVNVSLDLKHVK